MQASWQSRWGHRGRRLPAHVGRRLAGRGGRVNLLLASDLLVYTSEQQFHPFDRHARALEADLGLVTLQADLGLARALLALGRPRFDAVGLKLSFRTPAAEALRVTAAFRRAAGTRPLVYFDGDDDLGVQWPDVLAHVDLYLKKHAHRDRAAYLRPTIGKSNLTDHAARHFGASFADDIIPASPGLPAAAIEKISVLANIAEDAKIAELLARLPGAPAGPRPVDVVCRATVDPASWTWGFRRGVAAALAGLPATTRVLVPTERVSQSRYYEEMLQARLCVSPFGFGEICWRDFEAILCGAVLVKPDMGHVETRPDLFVPHATYLPVRGDFADLAETCARWLERPAELSRIAATARARLLDHLGGGGFGRRMGEVLAALAAGRPADLSPAGASRDS
ncbi:MAG: glycosyltransferase family 1 protein [Rhodobacteraceae bacterium]|nr:glycosyltransferase family 1 protein [Paracoccaceae bacterium]